ncbi:MAG TPA: hypothetical protein VMV41_05050 [Cellulomonadaceae bacterium]|nr:hypothetical protein [Cellulomonadaceae bacterium]
MSTKVHNGYRLAAGTDPFAFIASARAVLDPVRDRLDARILATAATALMDAATRDGADYPQSALTVAYLAHDDEQSKFAKTDRRENPNRFELVIVADTQTGRAGVLIYVERPELVDAFEALDAVEPYPYWNNSDQPDDVTDAEWDQRRDFWGRTVGSRPPAERGLSWRLRGAYDTGMISLTGAFSGVVSPLVVAEAPSADDRARGLAQLAVANAAIVGYTEARDLMRIVSSTMRTSRYPEVVEAAKALLIDIGPDTFTGGPIALIADIDAKRAQFTAAAHAAGAALAKGATS